MGLSGLTLRLWLPMKAAVRAGYATHGKTTVVLTDEHVRAIPKALHEELVRWGRGDQFLIIDAPSTDVPTIVRALTRAAVDRWLTLSDAAFVREIPAQMADDPRIRARLGEVLAREERTTKTKLALREYAKQVPYLARAASEEDYPIETPAIDHLTTTLASLDPSARVLAIRSAEYVGTKLTPIKSPSARAFEVRDRVLDHVARVSRPELVEVKVDTIAALRGTVSKPQGKVMWTRDEQHEVVPVRVTSALEDDRCILFKVGRDEDTIRTGLALPE